MVVDTLLDMLGELTNCIRQNILLEQRIKELEEGSSKSRGKGKKKAQTQHKPSWMTIAEPMGPTTAQLIIGLNMLLGRDVCDELPSIKIRGSSYVITEIDREKIVRTYCQAAELIVGEVVVLDSLLYNILIHDQKITDLMESTRYHGEVVYCIPLNGTSYVKQISCAIRRLDNL